jgi:4a-hydroxytetrahydrobiopterin dehydratase
VTRLAQEACEACTGSTPLVASAERDALLGELHADWRLSDDGTAIARVWHFRDFAEAFAFAVRVAFIAEAEEHHPDVTVGGGAARCASPPTPSAA